MLKRQPIRSKKLRESARGEQCTLRLPGICSHDTDTVVLCHLRDLAPAGMGAKPDDLHAVYACNACHDVIDGRRHVGMTPDEIGKEEGRALCETIRRMVDKSLLKVEGAK
jgi:hypothetical protein